MSKKSVHDCEFYAVWNCHCKGEFCENPKPEDKKFDIEQMKIAMKGYEDLFGNKLFDYHAIDSAQTLTSLELIIENHRTHTEESFKDFDRSLDNFKRKIGL